MFGWMYLFIGPAGIAGVAIAFAEYLGRLVGFAGPGVRLVAAGAIVIVAAASYRSVRGSSFIQGVATLGKVGALAAIVVAAFVLGDGSSGAFGPGAGAPAEARWSGVGLGLVAALWAYNGFQDMLPVAGEVRDPARALPRAVLVGTGIVVAIYLAANAAYLYVLPYTTLRASPLVASDAMVRIVGPVGAAAVAAAVMVSTFGTANALALTQPRVFYAMADAGLLFRPLARVHPRFQTPHVAIALAAFLGILLVLSQTFETLTNAFVLAIWPFYALSVAALYRLRRSRPDRTLPYRVPGYPLVPAVFIIAVARFVANAFVTDPVPTSVTFALILAGFPVYWTAIRPRTKT